MKRVIVLFLSVFFIAGAAHADDHLHGMQSLLEVMRNDGHSGTVQYRELSAAIIEYERLLAQLAAAEQRYDEAVARERSAANRALTAVTVAMTGAGGLMLGMGLAQQSADREWANRISNVEQYFFCTAAGRTITDAGQVPHASPQFAQLRAQFYTGFHDLETGERVPGLIHTVRAMRTELGMPPGIEAMEIIDTSHLYGGGAWDEGHDFGHSTAGERVDDNAGRGLTIAGGALAAGGTAVGIIGNYHLNVRDGGARGSGQSPQQIQQQIQEHRGLQQRQ